MNTYLGYSTSNSVPERVEICFMHRLKDYITFYEYNYLYSNNVPSLSLMFVLLSVPPFFSQYQCRYTVLAIQHA